MDFSQCFTVAQPDRRKSAETRTELYPQRAGTLEQILDRMRLQSSPQRIQHTRRRSAGTARRLHHSFRMRDPAFAVASEELKRSRSPLIRRLKQQLDFKPRILICELHGPGEHTLAEPA